ncbi:MAG: amidohydrolase family protein, partial [Burkholderiales bacterium]|nr:amidohydrolase family protein [Burkholderiales bacterium]
DLNDDQVTPETVQALARAMLASGVTTFLPTLITASESQLTKALVAVQAARRLDPVVANMVPYVHVEGPSIAPEDGPRGAHPAAHVRAPSVAEFERWQQASGSVVGMVTLSPHWPDSAAYISHVVASGVHVALGHTDASPAQIVAAVDAGARISTHLGNGMYAMINRRRNPFWAQLVDDRLCASFIADGHHLAPDLLKVMLRSKGLGQSMIVSDATAIGGMSAGHYQASIGGAVTLSANGRLSMNDGSDQYLAGAALPLLAGVANLVRDGGLGLSDALGLATVQPGRWVGGRGLLAPGQPADLIRFNWDTTMVAPQLTGVWLGGQSMI